jgi:rapamycin-insensitive companion of mTOR
MAGFRGRSVRGRYGKGRHQNEDEAVRLDYKKDHQENLKEIFVNITKADVPRSKKLGYYNAYVRLCHRVGPFQELVFTKEEMLVCLRQGLFCKLKETRAACLRSLRYFCHDWSTMSALLRLRIDYLIVRSIDICLDNDVERVHAMKLIRKLISIRPDKFPSSLLNPLISIANDGTKVRDKLVKTCLATICELAIYNPKLVAQQGGISAILHNVLEYHQQPRINESLMATILHLLNHPSTRHLIKADVDLEQMLAPFTDFDYRYSLELSDQLGTESEFKYDACKMALATIIKSWPGMIRLCKPDSSGLRSLIGMLYLPNLETRREIMDVLFDIFRLSVPDWTDDFAQAIASIDPSQMTESWKLSNGFVIEEAKCLLPHMTKTRPNLVDNHASLILSAFIKAGLFEALVETITTGSVHLSIRATVLLGKLLYLSGIILPDSVRHYNQCLPSLIEKTTKPDVPASQKIQACMAVNNLASLHAMKQRGLLASSLYLKELLNNHSCAAGKKNYRRYKTSSQYTDKVITSLTFNRMYQRSTTRVGTRFWTQAKFSGDLT